METCHQLPPKDVTPSTRTYRKSKSSRTSVINAAVQAIQRIEMRENTRNGSQSASFNYATLLQLHYSSLLAQASSHWWSKSAPQVPKVVSSMEFLSTQRTTCRQLQSSNRCVACHQCDSSSETLEACHVASGRVEQNKLKLCDVNW